MKLSVLLLALLTAALSLATAGPATTLSTWAAGREEAQTVTCDTRIQVIPSHGTLLTQGERRHAVRIGGVFFLGAKDYADFQRSEFERGPGHTAPVKTPYLVPTGASVTVAVAGPSIPHSDAEVGLDQRPYKVRADAVTLEPCPPDAEVDGRRVGRYTPFNAGFRVDGPQCLRLEVRTDDEVAPTRGRIALGRRTCR